MPNDAFPKIFRRLKLILTPFAKSLTVTADTPAIYSLDSPYSEKWKKAVFFAAVRIQKNYVGFYLMPVYMYPSLLKGASPELKKHMQGKSCFNFKTVEPKLFEELEALTKRGADRFRRKG